MTNRRRKARRHTIQIRVSREERSKLRAAAKSEGLGVSKWIRDAMLVKASDLKWRRRS